MKNAAHLGILEYAATEEINGRVRVSIGEVGQDVADEDYIDMQPSTAFSFGEDVIKQSLRAIGITDDFTLIVQFATPEDDEPGCTS